MDTAIKFKGQRIDNEDWVTGHFFISPLTDENSGTDPEVGWFFLTGEQRCCISNEHGVVFVVKPETVQVDINSINVGAITLEEYMATVHSRIKNAEDDAMGLAEIHKMVHTILGIE